MTAPEPEPGASELATPIDWLTYPHPQLYDMVHAEVDLPAADAAAGHWNTISEKLAQVGTDLRAAMAKASQGWIGESAEQTKQTVERLVLWCEDTAERAAGVRECVTQQAENVRIAQNAMPEPVHCERPFPMPSPEGGTAAMSANPFSGAGAIVADQGPIEGQSQEVHARAAEVMDRFQRDSHDVYAAVPDFSKPNGDVIVYAPPQPPPEEREPGPAPVPPPDDSTLSSGTPADSGDGPPPSGFGGMTKDSPAPGVVLGGGGAPVSGSIQEPAAPGSRPGAGQLPGAPGPGMAPAARGVPGPGGGMGMGMGGMMPMGAPGAQRPEETEHQRPGYLQDDENIFASDLKVAPPVLGEEGPRRRGDY